MNITKLQKLLIKEKALRKAHNEAMDEIVKEIMSEATRPLSTGKKTLREQALTEFIKYNPPKT